MHPLQQIKHLGVSIDLQGFDLALTGPDNLSEDNWDKAVELARQHKKEIVNCLKRPKHINWINEHYESLQRLGWSEEILIKLIGCRWWDFAVEVFLDEEDGSVNFVTSTGRIRCVHPNGRSGW